MTNNDNASIKMTFLQPAKSSSFWIFCHCFGHFGTFSKILKNISKLFEQWQKMTMSEKNAQFVQPAKLSLFFWWFFLVILVQFCQKYRQISKSIRKLTRNDMLREKCHYCNLQNNKTWQTKWQTKTLMTKTDETWQTKLKLYKKTKNERQNWNDKKSQQKSKMTN